MLGLSAGAVMVRPETSTPTHFSKVTCIFLGVLDLEVFHNQVLTVVEDQRLTKNIFPN